MPAIPDHEYATTCLKVNKNFAVLAVPWHASNRRCGRLAQSSGIPPYLYGKGSATVVHTNAESCCLRQRPALIELLFNPKGIAIVRITAAVWTLSLALLAFAPQIASAQEQAAPPAGKQQNFGPRAKQPQPGAAPEGPPPSETVAKIGSWQVQCGAVPEQGDQPAKKQCGMVQVTRSEKNERVGLSLIVMKMMNGGKQVTMMRVMAPIGVYLPTGVALEIDGAAVGRVPFTRCRPQICEALAEASAPTLEKMKKGNAATFIIYEAPGAGVPMKLSLEGFSKALAELDKY